MPNQTFTIRTDAVHYDLDAEDAHEAVTKAIRQQDWALIGSKEESRDIKNGAWLTVFDAEGVPVLQRGTMP